MCYFLLKVVLTLPHRALKMKFIKHDIGQWGKKRPNQTEIAGKFCTSQSEKMGCSASSVGERTLTFFQHLHWALREFETTKARLEGCTRGYAYINIGALDTKENPSEGRVMFRDSCCNIGRITLLPSFRQTPVCFYCNVDSIDHTVSSLCLFLWFLLILMAVCLVVFSTVQPLLCCHLLPHPCLCVQLTSL